MTVRNKSGVSKRKEKERKYYTLNPVYWNTDEGKYLRNYTPFESGFITKNKKHPDKYMVYPLVRERDGKQETEYYLVEHNQKNVESADGYSRFNMECQPLEELQLVREMKSSPYAVYKQKPGSQKRSGRKIKPGKSTVTKFLL